MRVVSAIPLVVVALGTLAPRVLTAQDPQIAAALDLERQGRPREAAERFADVLGRDPTQTIALLGMERTLQATGEVERIFPFLTRAFAARADEGFYPIKADDGEIIANHRVPNTLESQIEKLPGVIVAGNPHGAVTLNEFYDVNCPYCRQASGDIDALLKKNSPNAAEEYFLALAQDDLGRYEQSVEFWLRASERWPGTPYFQEETAARLFGLDKVRPGRFPDAWDRALKLLTGLNALYPAEREYPVHIGEALAGEGRFEEGLLRGIGEVSGLLERHFPLEGERGPNALPDAPVVLG